jgi:hypothetical protein
MPILQSLRALRPDERLHLEEIGRAFAASRFTRRPTASAARFHAQIRSGAAMYEAGVAEIYDYSMTGSTPRADPAFRSAD